MAHLIRLRNCMLVLFLSMIIMGRPTDGAESAADMARWAPEDAMLYVGMANLNTLKQKLKQSDLYGMYKDPSMQRFIVPAQEKIRAEIDKYLKEAWQEIGLEEPPRDLPWPQGRIMAVLFLQTRTQMIPDFSKMRQEDYQRDNFDPRNLPQKQVSVPDFQIVFMAEMGENMQKLQDLARKIASRAAEEGAIRQREEVRGVEINIFKEKPDADADIDTLCYGFQENWVIGGSSLKYIREVLMRITDPDRANLGRQRDFVEMSKRLGDSDFFLYVNADPIRKIAKASASGPERDEVVQTIQALGLEEITGLGVSLQMTPARVDYSHMKVQLGVRGEKKGIVKILTPETGALTDHRLLQKGLAMFLSANYDPMKIYEEIVRIAWTLGKVNLDGMIQGALMMAGSQGQGTQPPVNFREQVIGQLTKPLLVTTRIQKPFNEPDSSRSLLAIGVRDGEILDTALARLHELFIARGQKEMRRELLGHTIYLLPEIPSFNVFNMFDMSTGMDETPMQLAFGVAGDQCVFGSLSGVEQAIREIRREDRDSIQMDPMYQYARRYLPEQAGMYYYENQQITAEQAWYLWKEVLPKAKKLEKSAATQEREVDPDMPIQGLSEGPWTKLFEFVDPSLLPDFEAVKHYFGSVVGYVTENDAGIYAELIGLKAPGNGSE